MRNLAMEIAFLDAESLSRCPDSVIIGSKEAELCALKYDRGVYQHQLNRAVIQGELRKYFQEQLDKVNKRIAELCNDD